MEAQVLEAIEIDYIDESEVLSPADDIYHINKRSFKVPFVCGAKDLGEALRRINEGASMIRTKGEPGTGDIVQAVRHMRKMNSEIQKLTSMREDELFEAAKVLQLTYGQTLRKIVIPQVIKIVLPSIGNEVINLVKDSSLVYVIGLGDLLRAGNLATARDVTLVPLVLVALIYLLLIGLCTLLLRQLEKHYSYYR